MIVHANSTANTRRHELPSGTVSTVVIGLSVIALGLSISAAAADGLVELTRQLTVIFWALSHHG